MSLYEGAVKRPIMTSLCFLAVAIFGLFSLSKLPVDLYPDIETNTIMVMTSYQGASASDIENNVTRPLENTLIVYVCIRSMQFYPMCRLVYPPQYCIVG